MGETFKIRELQVADINGDLVDCLQALAPGEYSLKELKFAEEERHFSGCSWTFVAVNRDERIVGCVGLTRERKLIHNGAVVLRLEDLCVSDSYQGYGIGKLLVNYIVEYASCLKAYKILLNCKPELKTFYERLGFSDDGCNMRINLG